MNPIPRNLILTGFMGSGKSTVGCLVAERLGWTYADTDAWIEEHAGLRVAELFEAQGEAHFRAWEAKAALAFGALERHVIATGGRLMLEPANALDLGAQSITICLSARPETILARTESEPDLRPLLMAPDPLARIRDLLAERADAYARFPQVATDERSPEEVADEILAGIETGRWAIASPRQRHALDVRYPGGAYPVVVGTGLLADLNEWLPYASVLVTDSHVGPLWAGRCPPMPVITVPAGEQYKRLDTVSHVYDELLAAGLDRAGAIVALGGGVIGDMAGFAAATYLRGVACVLCPTSLLAMVDASVGGKTGVDLPQGKNLVGAFRQPIAVVADVDTLATLPVEELRAGMAEVLKHGLIGSPALLQQLADPGTREEDGGLQAGTLPQSLILRAIQVKRDVVEADPFEKGPRALLNLGHTFAHAVEQVTGYAVRHGEAVAMGLVAAADLSARLGHAPRTLIDDVRRHALHLGLPVRFPAGLAADRLQSAMQRDKKKEAGVMRFVLMRAIGDAFVSDSVPAAAVRETLLALGADGR